jgi:hypothetical protein
MERNLIRSLVLSLACGSLALISSSSALAQQPTTAPSATDARQPQVQESQPGAQPSAQPGEGDRSPRRFGRYGRGEGRFGGPGEQGAMPGMPSDANPPPPDQEERRAPGPFEPGNEEWDKAMAFMKEHSPKRTALMADLPEDFQQRIREQMFMRYRNMERLRAADKEMYDITLRRVGLEDELQALRMEVRFRGRQLTQDEMSRVREKVASLIDLNLEERELRVQRLRDILKREEEILAREKGQRESVLSENVSMIESGQRAGVLSGGFGGGFGGGGPGGGPRSGTPPQGAPPPPQPKPAP